jgi:hypothetical protein
VTAELPVYGFQMNDGSVLQVEAGSIKEAMQLAERDTGRTVNRGRRVDNFDNDAPAGRAELMSH